MNSFQNKKILVIHNNDFPSDDSSSGDQEIPPLFDVHDNAALWASARAGIKKVANDVCSTLKQIGFQNVFICPIETLEDLHGLINEMKNEIGVVFNLCESLKGDSQMEIKIADILTEKQVLFTGNSSKPLSNCLDKFFCSKLLKNYGVAVPDSFLIKDISDIEKWTIDPFKKHRRLIIKPNAEDGSTGIDSNSVVSSKLELRKKIENLYNLKKQDLIVQQYIEGKEFNVSILNPFEKIWAISEIDFNNIDKNVSRILNYSAKWDKDSDDFRAIVSVVPFLRKKHKEKILESAWRACYALEIDSYARIDFRFSDQNTPYIIDVNPNCDLDPESGFFNSFRFVNFSYNNIIKSIVDSTEWAKGSSVKQLFPSFDKYFSNVLYSKSKCNFLPLAL